jgi:hypothetical protein
MTCLPNGNRTHEFVNNGNRTHEYVDGVNWKQYHWFEKWNLTHDMFENGDRTHEYVEGVNWNNTTVKNLESNIWVKKFESKPHQCSRIWIEPKNCF